MSDLLLNSIQYGDYVSVVKFSIFAVLFFTWLPLISWVSKDAKMVGAKDVFWTAIIFGSGALAVILWLVIPVFFIGLSLFLVAMITPSIFYLKNRDSKVPEAHRILSSQFLKRLNKKKEKEEVAAPDELIFINAKNNNFQAPQEDSADFENYKIASDILNDLIWRRATDALFTPASADYNIVYHIDGAPLKQSSIPKQNVEHLISFVKTLAGLNINEKRKPQKGRFRIRRGELNFQWGIATAGSTAGEQLKLKQILQQPISKLTDIGLMPEQFEQLNKVHQLKQGIFLISGLKKTGVTSTFYSLLKNHDPYLNAIITLERQPTEDLPSISQNLFSLSDSSTTTFGKKLQGLLESRCDVIGIADCNDSETAKIASIAAKGGKLLYVTMEAENVLKALGKWVKLIGEKELAVENMVAITNQRLLRKLCEQCKEGYEPNKELLKKFNLPSDKIKVLYRASKNKTDKRGKPVICPVCQGTGFLGRIPIFEVIAINSELREFIKNAKSLSEIAAEFRKAQMRYLQEQALKQVVAGTTAITEIVRVLSTGEQIERKPAQT